MRWPRWLRAASAALLPWLATAALAQPAGASPAPIPAEAFFRHPDVLRAALSPSGTRLAVTTARGSTRVGLIVFELGDTIKATRAAAFSDVDIARFDWVNDDRLVFNVVDLESGSAADRWEAPGLYAVNADGSGFRQLVVRRAGPVFDSRQLGAKALTWNHQLLLVPPMRAGAANDEILIGNLVIRGNDLRHVQPMWLNVVSGRTRDIEADAPGEVTGWLFDRAGQPRVAVVRDKGRRTIHWRGPGESTWRVIGEGDAMRQPLIPRFVDEAGQLYVTHRTGPGGLSVLARYDIERRAPEAEPWVRVDGFDFSGELLGRSADGRPRGVRVQAEVETTVWFDERMKAVQKAAEDRLPGYVHRLSCARCGQDDMVVLDEAFNDRDPGQIWLYRPKQARWTEVARVMPRIDPARMGSVDLHRIRARDGLEIPVWVTRPAGHDDKKPLPAVVLVHGGPWVRGGYWRWDAEAQFLASRGYLVIAPDFRGSSGYGDAHFRAGWKQWGLAMQDDVADALLWARAQGLANDRACIVGASYGGYSTLMGLIRHPALYRCGIARVAVTDPFLYLEGSFWINDDISSDGRRFNLPDLVGDAKADVERLTAVSPVAQAARIRAPLLLGFGESDLRVPLAHGERLRDAMRKAGLTPEWVTYPGEGHSWRQVQTRVDFAQRTERFLAQHLGEPTK